MGKYLPFIVPVLAAIFVLIFGYFYIQAGKPAPSKSSSISTGPVEVPKTLPDKEISIEDLVNVPSPSPAAQVADQTQDSPLVESRLKALEAANLELKSRVAALEKPAPTPTPATSKSPLYIPLGGATEANDLNWLTMDTYTIILDPAEYPGVSSVILEINMKLNQASGTGYARLYNATDSKAVSSEASTTSDKYSVISSSGFTLSSGKKTYKLQLKSATGTIISVQNARLKINF